MRNGAASISLQINGFAPMPFHQVEDIRFFTFELFEDAGVSHGAITRRGGVSPHPWSSLNVGGTVGDEADRVSENRQRSFQALGRSFTSLFDVWQVHGKEVVCATAPRRSEQVHQKADVILTDRLEVTLFMRFADCVPIFLFDPFKKVVGLAHAGWLGTVQLTAAAAVDAMRACYGSRPQDILAGIGPSIGAHHYEVGPEVVSQVRAAFGPEASAVLSTANGAAQGDRALLDLWAANRIVLQRTGVQHIEIAGICTACGMEDWYSHRGEKGRTGRFGALIAL
jgi:purine-nucleoside/S-methyl-5'-thioadenosine phosphorylase / adenosine deaminase